MGVWMVCHHHVSSSRVLLSIGLLQINRGWFTYQTSLHVCALQPRPLQPACDHTFWITPSSSSVTEPVVRWSFPLNPQVSQLFNSRMRSEGFSFYIWGSGGWHVFAWPCFWCPPSTCGGRGLKAAVSMGKVTKNVSVSTCQKMSSSRFAAQAWRFVTFEVCEKEYVCARPLWQKSCRVYGKSHISVSVSTCQKMWSCRFAGEVCEEESVCARPSWPQSCRVYGKGHKKRVCFDVSEDVVISFCVAGVALCDIRSVWGGMCVHDRRAEKLPCLLGEPQKTCLFRRVRRCGHVVLRGRRDTLHSTVHTPHLTLYKPHSTHHTLHSTLHTLHFTLYTSHFTLHTLHFTLYTPRSKLDTPHSTLYTTRSTLHTLNAHSTLHTLHSTLYTHTVQSALHTLHSTLYTPHCTLYTSHCALHTVHTVHSTLYTPHLTPYTLHFKLHTLHSTLHTLHPTLHTLHNSLHTPHSKCTLHTPHSPLYTLHSHCTVRTPHSTLHTLHSTLYTLHFTLYTSHFTLHTAQSTLHTVRTVHTVHSTLTLHTLHFTLHIPHFTPHTLHNSLHTLNSHSALYTSHSTFYTPHSTLYTPHATSTFDSGSPFLRSLRVICIRVRWFLLFGIVISPHAWVCLRIGYLQNPMV